jgi:hypothetical protein
VSSLQHFDLCQQRALILLAHARAIHQSRRSALANNASHREPTQSRENKCQASVFPAHFRRRQSSIRWAAALVASAITGPK